jgi:predicted RNase H-like nuclease (RuvC/YqgF family)
MGQVEKLRALLAEAHDRLRKARYLTPVTMSEQIGDLVGRIDAALAEPVEGCERCEETEHQMHLRVRASYDKTIADSWRAKVAEVERERDEAWVKIDRLNRTVTELREELEKLHRLVPIGTYSIDWNREQERLRLTEERNAALKEVDILRDALASAENSLAALQWYVENDHTIEEVKE